MVKVNLDKLGICASAVCAVHCLVTPLIILLFPFAGLAFLEWEEIELGFLVLSFFLAVASLVASYFLKHKNSSPTILASFGFILFVAGKLVSLESVEIILSVLGGSFVILAHYRNILLVKKRAV